MKLEHPIADSFAIGRCMSDALSVVRMSMGPLWLGGLLLTISDGCGSNIPSDLPSMPGSDEAQSSSTGLAPARVAAQGLADGEGLVGWVLAVVLAVALMALFVGVLLFCLNCWAQTGSIRLHRNIIVDGNDELPPLFSGGDRFVDMVGWKLLSGGCVSAAVIVGAWPGALLAYVGYTSQANTLWVAGVGFAFILALPLVVYVALGVFLGDQVLVLQDQRPVNALRGAWSIARGNRFPLLLFAFVCILVELVSVLGILLCCVGALFTVPIGRAVTELAKTEGFLVATRGLREAQAFHLWRRLAEDQAREAGTVGDPGAPPAAPGGGPPPGAAQSASGPRAAGPAPRGGPDTTGPADPAPGYVPVPPPPRDDEPEG